MIELLRAIVIGIILAGVLAGIGALADGQVAVSPNCTGGLLVLFVVFVALFLFSRLFSGGTTTQGGESGGGGGGGFELPIEPDPGPRRGRRPGPTGGGGGELPVLEGEVVEEPRYIGIAERKRRALETTKTHEEVFAPRLPAPKRKVR